MVYNDIDNKERITRIATELFAQQGYNAVSVQEICEKAKVTKPTLYYYFTNKKGLLEYITDTYGNELISSIKESLVYEHDFIKSLTKILKAEIQFAKQNKDYFSLHLSLLNSPEDSEEREVYKKKIYKIRNIYKEFFILSANEFGNMRSKEILYSEMFHNIVISTSMMIAKRQIPDDEKTIYQIIHSAVYGFAD